MAWPIFDLVGVQRAVHEGTSDDRFTLSVFGSSAGTGVSMLSVQTELHTKTMSLCVYRRGGASAVISLAFNDVDMNSTTAE